MSPLTRALPAAAAVLLLGACTHISTTPDLAVTGPQEALPQVSYSLPMLQYQLALTRTLARCPEEKTWAGVTFTDPTLALNIEAAATPRYVPGERYNVDYDALSSWWKISSFSLERWPSGTLKSLNATADDQTDEVVKAGVKTAILVASLSSNPGAAAAGVAKSGGSSPRTPAQILSDMLRASLVSEDIVGCEATAQAKVAARAANRAASKTKVAELAANTRDIVRLTTLANLKALDAKSRRRLNDLVRNQVMLDQQIADLDDALGDVDAALVRKEDGYWPRVFTATTGSFDGAPKDREAFSELLEKRRGARILDKAAFALQLNQMPLRERLALRDHFPKELGSYVDAEGAVMPAKAPLKGCQGAGASVEGCLASAMAISVALMPVESGPPACGAGVTAECLVTVAHKTDATIVQARDTEADAGIFIRDASDARLVVCKGGPCDLASKNLVTLDSAFAPQLGQLRFLPFRNGVMEANELTVALAEDGRISKIEYKRPKAAAQRFATAAADVASQVQAERDRRRKAQDDADAAARAERAAQRTEAAALRDTEVADVQAAIDLLTKQRALTKLNTPETPDEFAAQNEEITRNQKTAAVLESRLAIYKAQKSIQEAGYPAQ